MSRRASVAVPVALAVCVLAPIAARAASADGPRARALPASSCGPVVYEGQGRPRFLIASDLPLRGEHRPQAVAMTRAIRLVLARRAFKAGTYQVAYQSCDDSTAAAGRWDPAKCTANAQVYATEPTVLGVIGTFDSPCAKLMIPILNRAPLGPVSLVSPANTSPGLTKAAPGFTSAEEPGIYYPTGRRNLVRLLTTDDLQPLALARLTRQLGRQTAYVLDDGQAYGRALAQAYVAAGSTLGVEVAGRRSWDPAASGYEQLAKTIRDTGAQVVFLGGLVDNNGGRLVRDLRTVLGRSVTLLAADGFLPIATLTSSAGAAAEGLYVSAVGYPNERLGRAGRSFAGAFRKAERTKAVDRYAMYAAQAAEVLLDAIARSGGTRETVRRELLESKVEGGILGSFTFDRNGDTSLRAVTVYRVRAGSAPFFRLALLRSD